jgi:multicomponent Na+:H+ antiporter subunit B
MWREVRYVSDLYSLTPYVVLAVSALASTIAVYLAVTEKDLIKAVLYSAIQSTFYALIFYLLMVPDIVLVYIPVAVGLLPAILIIAVKKTERYEDVEGVPRTTSIIVLSLVTVFTLIAGYLLVVSHAITFDVFPSPDARLLAKWFLATTLWWNRLFSSMSPEAVTAIVWDYRGLDTYFETSVMYLAIIGALAIARYLDIPRKEYREDVMGMSIIGKMSAKIIVPMIIIVAISIALHGHLTPGGGFQGGVTGAVTVSLLIFIFSVYFATRFFKISIAILLRIIGLAGIVLSATIVAIIGFLTGQPAYIFQNQPKIIAQIGLPYEIGGNLISGTLLLFNTSEFLAVFMGFAILFLLLSIPEENVLEVIKGEVE